MEKCNGILTDACKDCGFRFFCFTNPRTLKPLPDYGDLMTIEEFINACKTGMFIDYDGSGRYATATEITTIDVYPSDVMKDKLDKRWTHVMWFNK